MVCIKCGAPSVVQYKTGSLCAACFVQSVEKRVRQGLWAQSWVKPGDRLVLVHDGSTEAFVTERLVRGILGSMPVQLEVRRGDIGIVPVILSEFDRVVLPWDLDDEVRSRFSALLYGTRAESLPEDSVVKVLLGVQDWEVREYALLVGLPVTEPRALDRVDSFLARMEERVPGTKFALLKGLERWDSLSGALSENPAQRT